MARIGQQRDALKQSRLINVLAHASYRLVDSIPADVSTRANNKKYREAID